MTRRADFVHASRGRRSHTAAFTLQVTRQIKRGECDDAAPAAPRIGFTVTKKVGNAVVRNRIRRRLREAVRLSESLLTEPGHDYVVVARREALAVPFKTLMADLAGAVRRGGRSAPRPRRESGRAD